MKKTIRNVALAVCLGLSITALSATASNIFTDTFNYTVGQSLEDQTNWSGLNSGSQPQVASGNLSVPGLAPSTGNMASWESGNIREALASFAPQTSGTVFFSFAFRVDSLPTATTYSFSLANNNTFYAASVWLRTSGTQFEIGLSNRSNSAVTYASDLLDAGSTYFLVGSYDLENFTSELWLNPDSSTFGSAVPTSTLSATGGTDLATISQFLIRGANGSPAMTMDELRIGSTWASVTPIPEPSTYAALFGLLALGFVAWRRRR
ncbi:MAG: PEP-CTERM sorting domain-containing protein [Verrucomicrobia bacterium]|nr:PEP-CTERM sorting domain-containing protein [Verrucomicrobiota bacterium]